MKQSNPSVMLVEVLLALPLLAGTGALAIILYVARAIR